MGASDTTIRAQPCVPARTAKQLDAEARAAIAPGPTTILTPALPTRWPGGGGGVAIFAYAVTPLPTGRVVYRMAGPVARVEFATLDARPIVERFDPVQPLGDEEPAGRTARGLPERLARAAETMVEVLAGCRSADEARDGLAPYEEWLAQRALIAADVRRRAAPLLDWLAAGAGAARGSR